MPEWSSDYEDHNPEESEYSTEEDCDYTTDEEHSDLLYRSDPYFQESEIVPDPLIDT